jgi:voltage-gated potassium channel
MSLLRSQLHKLFHATDTKRYQVLNIFLMLVTIVSIVAITLETVHALQPYQSVFNLIEYVTVAIFSLEYIARFFANKKPLHYVVSFWGAIDLLAILPSFLGLGNLTFLKSARLLRALRFLRMLRVIKVTRSELDQKHHDEHAVHRLNMEIYFLTLISAVVIFGTLIYVFEGPAVPFENIPVSMIWSAKLLLGGTPQDMVATVAGEIIVILSRFTGLMLFGILITVVGGVLKKIMFGTPTLEESPEVK